MRNKGRISSWNDDKGYGFITPLAGGKRVFIHINALGNRNRHPEVNDVVTYGLSKDKQGRPCAANATLAGDKLKRKTTQKSNPFALLFALAFLFAVGVSVATGALSGIILVVYVAMSLITFAAYAFDKSAAKSGRWRTSEGTLQFLGLIGGWPGAVLAQQTLRHKSKKTSFLTVFWTTVLANCAALIWLHMEEGRAFSDSLIGGVF